MKERRADLHIHTLYSDGSQTPEEVVKEARRAGIDCIAITDHDSVEGIKEAQAAGAALGVEVIPAVEVSAEYEKKELHILGYFVNPEDKKFLSFLSQIREDRVKRLFRMADALTEHGLKVDAKEIMKFAGNVSISRLHIARYLHAKKLVSSIHEAFSKYIGDGKPCYVSRFRHNPAEAADIIKEAGGAAVIAHPGLNHLKNMIPQLISQGIDGIEAFHSEHDHSTSSYYEKYAKAHGLLITGGSDCHGSNKKERMGLGKTTIPYSYVEALKAFCRR